MFFDFDYSRNHLVQAGNVKYEYDSEGNRSAQINTETGIRTELCNRHRKPALSGDYGNQDRQREHRNHHLHLWKRTAEPEKQGRKSDLSLQQPGEHHLTDQRTGRKRRNLQLRIIRGTTKRRPHENPIPIQRHVRGSHRCKRTVLHEGTVLQCSSQKIYQPEHCRRKHRKQPEPEQAFLRAGQPNPSDRPIRTMSGYQPDQNRTCCTGPSWNHTGV